MSNAVKTKECRKCGKEKPVTDFHTYQSGRLGRRAQCKSCINIRIWLRKTTGPCKSSAEIEIEDKNNGFKCCRTCDTTRTLDDFDKLSRGWRTSCKLCVAKVKEKRKDGYRQKYKNDPNYTKNKMCKAKYGITLEQKGLILAGQGSVCFVCGESTGPEKNFWHVDHEHDGEKRVRGILCQHCNIGLGRFKDKLDRLIRAFHYLVDPPAPKILQTGSPVSRPSLEQIANLICLKILGTKTPIASAVGVEERKSAAFMSLWLF